MPLCSYHDIPNLCFVFPAAQIVPCYARKDFELVRRSLFFRFLRGTYKIHVKHKHSKTRLYGKGWEELIKLNNLRIGDMLVFSMTGRNPKISVLIMDFGKNTEDTDENSSDSNSDEDSESEEEDSYIVAQRVHLKNHEKYSLLTLLPQRAKYVGVPFVTRLTSTNLNQHDMVTNTIYNASLPLQCTYVYIYI